ncbi:MAG: glycosyltransferase family 39 protein [Terracidiphilus sp.]
MHKRWFYVLWLLFIAGFALLHTLHLSADFPNHTPWTSDWAKYTDEGWYGNAAIRAHLFGNWYIAGDFTPAPALPVLPFLEWLLFFITGVSVEAARGLAVAFFFINLLLSYLLLRARGPRWMALLGVTLLVTSPFLYCFSRLAILEPVQIAFTLAAFNLAVRLPRLRRPVAASAVIGVLFSLMLLTKTTAAFLLPAVGWAMIASLCQGRYWLRPCTPQRMRATTVRCIAAATGAFLASYTLWVALVFRLGLFPDYKYFFLVNYYPKPKEFYWPLVSLWWSFHGGLWMDHILIPLAGIVLLSAASVFCWRFFRRNHDWMCGAGLAQLVFLPEFGGSLLAVAGAILFMTLQNRAQPRYFAPSAFFCIFIVVLGAAALPEESSGSWSRRLAPGFLALIALTATFNAWQTWCYATHPEYTYLEAARRLTQFIDAHPNGNRLLLSISGDQITLFTHLPSLCDDFSMQDLEAKTVRYRPGWYAAWNDLDPGTLSDLHQHFSLEQVASFRALDDSDRNLLVLFKLHPLPDGHTRGPEQQNLQILLPDDKVQIEVQ